MKLKKFFLLLILLFISSNSYAENGVSKGRKIIKQMQKEVREFLLYTDFELKNKTPEFKSDYKNKVLPRYKNIAANIDANAIKWVDINYDQDPELIFWTEGLGQDVEGLKEFLFIVDVEKNQKPLMMLIHQLNPEPTKTSKNYEYARFEPYPNRSRGYNNFLCAVFSYANFGINATNFVNYEIFWNKFQNKIDISEFFTSFPVAVEKVENSDNWENSAIKNP